MANPVIDGYAADAVEIIPRYEALPTETVLGAVLHLIPTSPCRVLDVGAGTGRNPAWFAAQGHRVTACEPVDAFRLNAVDQYRKSNIRWLDDTLPGLAATKSVGEFYDFILLSGVWHHVSPQERAPSMASLAHLMAPGAGLIISVRHGRSAPNRPSYDPSDEEVERLAIAAGLEQTFLKQTEAIQAANRAAGVTWTWFAFSRP
ncbi:MAG: class I SAM-dependent methyltransferase [Candidatus Phaeomarinobacter sp.]